MAVLNSTSPGQLSKYVIPTVQKLDIAMKKGTSVSRGSSKSQRLKNNAANANALKEFARIGSDPRQQKEALKIPLEVMDTKQGFITIGSVDKPNIKFHKIRSRTTEWPSDTRGISFEAKELHLM